METDRDPQKTLEACINLLKGEEDEQKIAGLLLVSKHLRPCGNQISGENSTDSDNAIKIFNAVGLQFLEKMLRTPIHDSYSSSYCAVSLSFLSKLHFSDNVALQGKIIQLIVPLLQLLNDTKIDELRDDIISIISMLSTNVSLSPLMRNKVVMSAIISASGVISTEVGVLQKKEERSRLEKLKIAEMKRREEKEKEKEIKDTPSEIVEEKESSKKESIFNKCIFLISRLAMNYPSDSSLPVILLLLLKLSCSCPPSLINSLLPSISSLLLSTQSLSSPLAKHTKHLILFHLHWTILRCFTYKYPESSRVYVLELVWTAVDKFRYDWMTIGLSDEKNLGVPEKESNLSNDKLVIYLSKMTSIEIRVQLDYLYKDIISAYEQSGDDITNNQDKDISARDISLRLLFSCLQIIMSIMKEAGNSVDTENSFSAFDYDTIISISTSWAESLKCVKEFISLALALSKTDIYKREYTKNSDFHTMNIALEYSAMFINDCLTEFPDEVDDDKMVEDLLAWHEEFNFHL